MFLQPRIVYKKQKARYKQMLCEWLLAFSCTRLVLYNLNA